MFGEIGLVKCDPVNIGLKGDAEPYCVTVAHTVPVPLQDDVKIELECVEGLGITKKITEPTPWCAPMVPAFRKNGKIRICVDLKRLNQSVTRENHTLQYWTTSSTDWQNRQSLASLTRPVGSGKHHWQKTAPNSRHSSRRSVDTISGAFPSESPLHQRYSSCGWRTSSKNFQESK